MNEKNVKTTQNPTSKPEYQIDVIDHPSVGMWMKDIAKKDVQGFIKLVGPNEKEFTKLYGKANWTNDGSKGWTHGWTIYENSMHWLILTGPKGTYFRLRVPTPGESYLNDPRVGVGIIQYLNTLLKKISN